MARRPTSAAWAALALPISALAGALGDKRRGLRPIPAGSWEIVDDLTRRAHPRQGVTFHDGAPFDAETVEPHPCFLVAYYTAIRVVN